MPGRLVRSVGKVWDKFYVLNMLVEPGVCWSPRFFRVHLGCVRLGSILPSTITSLWAWGL